MRRTRLWVVSPRDFVRAGVVGAFSQEGSFEVRAGESSEDAKEWADVVLFDALSLHDSAEDLRALGRDRRVVALALTHGYRPVLDEQAARLGAAGCVGLNWSAGHAVSVVRAALDAASRTTCQETLARRSSAPSRTSSRSAAFEQAHGLTNREAEVLTLVAVGLSNQQIERELFLGANSVKSHLRGAYAKIGVSSRTQAVVWCYEHGPVRPSGG